MNRSRKIAVIGAVLYVVCALMDWGYWIAWSLTLNNDDVAAKMIVLGWLPAVLWPVHLTAKFWGWIL